MDLTALIYCSVLLLAFLVIASCLWSEKRAGISPTPTLPHVMDGILKLMAPHTTSSGTYNIAELGSGWGGSTAALSSHYRQADITGYEISLWPRLFSQARTLLQKRIAISKLNFLDQDISGYDIIFCYLSPRHMEKLKPQFATLKPGSLIVSNAFPILGWTPLATETLSGLVKIPIFIYRTA